MTEPEGLGLLMLFSMTGLRTSFAMRGSHFVLRWDFSVLSHFEDVADSKAQ